MRRRLLQGDYPGCMKKALLQDETFVITNPLTDCPDCPLAGQYGGRAGFSRRLSYQNRVYGLVAVSVPAVYGNDAEEQVLFEELAEDLSSALHRAELSEQLHRFRHIALTIPNPMAFVSRDYRYLAVNDVYSTFYKTDRERIVGRSIAEFLDPLVFETEVKPQLDRCLAGEMPTYEVEVDFPGKGMTWMEMGYFPYRDERGEIVGVVSHGMDITDRKQTEEALENSRALLKRSQEIALIGSWDLDLTDNRLTWSDEAYEIFGLDPGNTQISYEVFLEAVLPEDRAAVEAAYWGSLKEGRDIYDIDHRIVRKDTGEIRFVHERCEHLRDSSGRVVRSVGMVQDITGRKKAEEKLKASEARYRVIFEGAKEGIVALNPVDMSFHFVNTAMAAMSGYAAEEFKFLRLDDLVHPDDLPHLPNLVEDFLNKESPGVQSIRCRRKDGSFYYADITASLLNLDNISLLICFFTDVTDRVRLEDREYFRRRVLELVVKGKSLSDTLDFIVEYIEDQNRDHLCSILLLDRDGKRLHHGSGPSLPDFYNEAIDGLEIGDGVGSCGTSAHNKALVVVEDVSVHPYWAEFRELARAAGLGSCWSMPILSEKDEVLGTFAIYHWQPAGPGEEDLDLIRFAAQVAALAIERKLIEESLVEAKAGAEAANSAKSVFLANMSHEIRTPLNAILGFTNLTLESDLNGQQQEYLRHVRSSAGHLLELINEILDLSKIEAGRMELDISRFSLRTGLNELLETQRLRAGEKGVALVYQIDQEVPDRLEGDAGRLHQVLINLVANAIKFTAKGEIRIRVSLAEQKGDRARVGITVADTGIGIPLERQKVIFEPFSQGDISITRKFGGTGLGLAICKHFVAMMGGEIFVESTPGLGSTFGFTALFKVSVEERTGSVEVVSEGKAAPAVSDLKILLAEDNLVNRKLVSALLNKAGHTVSFAENGREAVELHKKQDFDLILMDVEMPEMDGLEATTRIRNTPRDRSRRIPIIAMTAHAMKGDRERFLEAGMDDYLAKPIDRNQMMSIIERCGRHNADRGPAGRA